MWRTAICLGLMTFVTATQADSISPDLSGLAGQFDPSGAAAAARAAMLAAMPQPASTVPPAEVPGGAAGSAAAYRRADAVQPRITRSKTITTAADGTATFDWTATGAIDINSSPSFGIAYAGAGVPSCVATAQTTTSLAIKCTMQLTVTVVGISVLGAPVPAAALKVGVIMLPPS